METSGEMVCPSYSFDHRVRELVWLWKTTGIGVTHRREGQSCIPNIALCPAVEDGRHYGLEKRYEPELGVHPGSGRTSRRGDTPLDGTSSRSELGTTPAHRPDQRGVDDGQLGSPGEAELVSVKNY